MTTIEDIYNDVGRAMKGVCERIYPKNRPRATDTRVGSYMVVRLPSTIYNWEIGGDGGYNDFTTTVQLEIYARNAASSKSPNGFDVGKTSEMVKATLARFPIVTEHIYVGSPMVTMQADDGDGFDVTIIQGRLRTK